MEISDWYNFVFILTAWIMMVLMDDGRTILCEVPSNSFERSEAMLFNNLKSITKLSLLPCLLHILFIQMIFSLFTFWALHNVMFIMDV